MVPPYPVKNFLGFGNIHIYNLVEYTIIHDFIAKVKIAPKLTFMMRVMKFTLNQRYLLNIKVTRVYIP